MLNNIIKNYCIQQVGIQYTDMIISKSNFISAVKEFNALGYYIAEVCWWKHNKIGEVSDDFSMGGPVDENNEKYFFGETDFGKNFKKNSLEKNLDQVLTYYADFIQKDKYDLYPSLTLDIAFKKQE